MKYYPIFLDVAEKNCLVVGAGEVGSRKALGLLKSGARVRVVSKVFTPRLQSMEGEGLCLTVREYNALDLEGVFLVFAATNNRELNHRILADARDRGILCNGADDPGAGDFILPSVVTRGDLVCAVSTSGASPALARKLKNDLEQVFGPEYESFLTLMANIRKYLLSQGHDPAGHKKIFRALVAKDLPALIAADEVDKIDQILNDLLGLSYDSLVPKGV